MVTFWPWRKEDSSPASFERTLSALSAKIAITQTRLDSARSKSRRIKVLSTLYLGFAYLVYAIVAMLVIGWRSMGTLEWTGMAGGPVFIYLVRAITTAIFDYRIDSLNSKLKSQQTERAKTIQKLKDATKYDSTLELLEKYGGPENKSKKGKKKTGDDDGKSQAQAKQQQQGTPSRTNMPPPPTANIQRPPASVPGTPQPPRPQSARGTRQQQHFPEPDMDASAEFAPNAFDGKGPPSYMQYPPATASTSSGPHWYDRILDTLLGEDETAARNRIVLICARCRLVNGQAPPGTKSLSELGSWKCMGCGAVNGEMDEGKRLVQEVLGARVEGSKTEMTTDDEDVGGNSSDLVEVDKEDASEPEEGQQATAAQGLKKRKGKRSN
ncbi:hypothetical protein B0H66DRAFT_598655 [Apodospora peruviana]|uniref:Endoplasmic reticulum junction formation protein lunapark n=1 Tax=Apodospora peruviana TaxID=516989 RepID=A0AAE0MGB7_9PEZI|nr:hypothetical protein B0H66DRAFT_598655 [Apodospora peruviana]